ncbi:hybrid sensor histidine kinase/response regulator [Catalinimonas niigatensis]|uniref:hybrid sensor histidine kinase/response regulator n=1 Tax=Catalinimonas niigatensis TaxID=1397264 RepID=UPI002664F617|nr:ATP-binding protein [Catalinimonas niigatensis]WPP49516.1 ATP-binding protein [Catalinimonas niigatensis]
MRMNRSFYLKSKVLLGFGFVLIAIAGASVIAYNSYEELSEAVKTISQPDAKIKQIDSIMFIVGKSENSLQEYTITKSAEKLQQYAKQVSDIRQRVQELKQMNTYDESDLDSILSLINAKLVSMDDFMAIKERRDVFEFYDRAIEELERERPVKKDTVQTQHETTDETQNQKEDTVKISENIPEEPIAQAEEKKVDTEEDKKLLRRILGIFSRKKQEPDTTEIISESEPLPDSLTAEVDTATFSNLTVDSVRQILNTLKREQADTERYLDRQELKYLSNNAEVMNQINELISSVKQAQQESYQAQLEGARIILQTSLSRLGLILLIALGSSFIFIYLIFSDIAKSDFLKTQLERAKAHAEQLAKVKEDFLANMSHEIRTPLTAILGFTSQLKNTKLQEPQQEYLAAIDSSSSHLLALVNDILDFSKIEAGKLKFEHQPFDMKALMEQMYRDMQFQAEKKDLQIHLEIKGEEYRYLKGDAFRLKQVLYNLISNAIKFTEEGGVIVRCKLKPMDKEKIKAQLEVVDTGIGIPPEKQKNIFEAFVQTDASDTRKYGGTGLGLSISKKIVESQGGEVALESELGEGSTFYVALPYEISTEEEFVNANHAAGPLVEKIFPESKLLIIDDDSLNTKLLSLIVEKWAVQTFIAHSGEEGLEILKNTPIDLVLTDLQMPGMHGEEVASQIRAMDGVTLPIIAFTARVTENKHYFEEKGFADVLHKPFNEREVYNIIEKYLNSQAVTVSSLPEEGEIAVESNEGELYSLSNITRFIGDDQEALVAFLDSFMDVMIDSTAEMKKAVESGDIQTVAYHAHKMFPNVQQLEVEELAKLLRKLEHQGQLTQKESPEEKFPLEETVTQVIYISEKLIAALLEKKELLKTQVS